MPDISITDNVGLTASLQLTDTSPFSFSKLASLNFNNLPVVSDFKKPIDQSTIRDASCGVKLTAPSLLIGDGTQFIVQSEVTGELSIHKPSDKTLFDDDGFTPEIAIANGECWIGFEVQTSLTAKVSAAFDGFGVGLQGTTAVGLGTHLLLKSASGVLPTLEEGLKAVLNSYTVARNAAAVRNQPLGIATTAGLSGTVKFSASYSLPVNVNPLATAGLPFQYQLTVNPEVTLEIAGELALLGDFVLRCYKTNETQLIIGLYKKKETRLAAKFTGSGGLTADVGKTDVLTPLLGAIFPATKATAAGFAGEDAEALQDAVKDCVDDSLSAALNGSCSASKADESAVVYAIDLAANASQTDDALTAAFHGNWTLIDRLPNAKRLRNIFREKHERTHKITVNLLGFYNAIAADDYLKSCTILRDPNGPIVIVDKVRATHIAAAGLPHLADDQRLRSALAEGFLSTVTYAATRLKDFTVQQSYEKYAANMSSQDLRRQVLLGRALRLITNGAWDAVLSGNSTFDHAKASVTARYSSASVLRLFFSDPASRTAYRRDQLERAGRNARTQLLDQHQDNGDARLKALADDVTWSAMDESGNTATFKTFPGLRSFNENELGAIEADWIDIAWWTDAMQKVAPKLVPVLAAAERSTAADPTTDPEFMKARQALQDSLASVATHAKSAFGDGWGLLVLFLLSEGVPALTMDLGWNEESRHYESGEKAAAAPGS
jgi:hypothetical protein